LNPATRRLLPLLLLLLTLLLLALAWQFSPARDWLAPQQLLAAARELSWALQLAVFVLAGCLAVPLSLLVLLTVLVQGPLAGAATALLAGTLIGLASFAAGALLGRQAVAQVAGPRVQAINALVARRGLLAVFIVRLVPAAPYALVNLVLGTTPLPWQVFLLGNLLGMLPMVGFTAWLAPEILAQLQQPSRTGWALLLAVLALIAVATWLLKKWASKL
jgi:uncharacterized membrane protein YdjX (TVP38/TMEM64 family)